MTAVAQAPAAAGVRDAGRRVEALLDELTAAGPDVVAAAGELVRALTELYGEALSRLVAELDADAVRRLTRDDLLAGLLVLHDLHPDALPERVLAALDAVRPALGAHAGGVELLGIRDEPDGAVVALRLSGSCHGCPSSLVTVRDAIERAILSTAPEVWRIDVEGLAPVAAPGKGEPALLQISPHRPYAEDGSDCPAVVGAAAGVSG